MSKRSSQKKDEKKKWQAGALVRPPGRGDDLSASGADARTHQTAAIKKYF